MKDKKWKKLTKKVKMELAEKNKNVLNPFFKYDLFRFLALSTPFFILKFLLLLYTSN